MGDMIAFKTKDMIQFLIKNIKSKEGQMLISKRNLLGTLLSLNALKRHSVLGRTTTRTSFGRRLRII